MRLRDWLKPGLQLKRWLLLGTLGILFTSYALGSLLYLNNLEEKGHLILISAVVGILLIYFAFRIGMDSLLRNIRYIGTISGPLDKNKINKQIYDKKILSKGPKVVTIGGGTGLSVLLRGLKLFTSNITAIVTVADDGGGSGKLREDLGMLPPGDIRNCILALAEMEPTMEKLLQYRFEDGNLKGQSFGNLLIASMNGISDSFEEAIKKINEVLAVTGNVFPVTLEDITLFGKLENGMVVRGESNIPLKSIEQNCRIERVFIKPKEAEALQEAISAILSADIIVLGPGSLYTSILPNLLVKDICKAITKTKAKVIYIPNIMTQPGETGHYSLWEHVETIINHCPSITIDYVIANKGSITDEVYSKYMEEGAQLVKITDGDRNELLNNRIKLIEDNLVEIKRDYVRHDAVKLSKLIISLDNK